MQTRHLDVAIDDSTQYATVFGRQGQGVMGTLRRRHAFDGKNGPAWRIFEKTGAEVGQGFSTAYHALKALDDVVTIAAWKYRAY